MASLSLKHIYKKYPGGVTAVSDFCLEIKDKEFLIFVGPSGCGKTTKLKEDKPVGLTVRQCGDLS